MATSGSIVCRLDDLADPGSMGVTLDVDGLQYDAFIVRRGYRVYAFLNSCPHTGGPLDWVPHQFLNLDKTYIQCATHDALFRIDDGRCVSGPCPGGRLTALPVAVEAGDVIIEHHAFTQADQ